MKINRPVAPPRAAAVESKPTPAAPAKPEAQGSKGWTPDSPIGRVERAFNAGVEQAKKLNEATKPATKNTEGRTATTPYKYEGVIEVGLEAANRTFEGGGIDLAKGAKFIAQNAKLPDNE